MKSNPWGYMTWSLFHTLIELLPEKCYNELGPKLLNIMKSLCTVLPCPECSEHATEYLRGITFNHLPTKQHFKIFLHQFHNTVNYKTRKPFHDETVLEQYKKGNIRVMYRNVYILFTKNYGNSRMMMYSVRRGRVLKNLNQFIQRYYCP